MKSELTLEDRNNLIEYRLSRATETLEEARTGKTVGPFHSTKELMEDLLN